MATALIMLLMIWFGTSTEVRLNRNPLEGSEFPRARVLEALEGTGQQILRMEIRNGEFRGKIVDVRNIMFIDAAVNPRVGQTVIIHFDYFGGGNYSAHVHSYVRDIAIYLIAFLFLVLLAVVGGKKGLSSAFGLVFSFVTILFFLIPAIMRGGPPAVLTIFVAILITTVSLIAIMGFEKKTWVSIAGTLVGIGFYCLFYLIISAVLRISGANIPEMNQLVILNFSETANLTQLLFCGILIASLGAISDTTVSVASATAEIAATPQKFDALLKSSMRMARDCIGSSANTLILAFTGTFFITLIMFQLHELNYTMLINRVDIAIEVLRAVSASVGMILCAPATAALGSYAYSKWPKVA